MNNSGETLFLLGYTSSKCLPSCVYQENNAVQITDIAFSKGTILFLLVFSFSTAVCTPVTINCSLSPSLLTAQSPYVLLFKSCQLHAPFSHLLMISFQNQYKLSFDFCASCLRIFPLSECCYLCRVSLFLMLRQFYFDNVK